MVQSVAFGKKNNLVHFKWNHLLKRSKFEYLDSEAQKVTPILSCICNIPLTQFCSEFDGSFVLIVFFVSENYVDFTLQ